jgi:hypothetical protein
VTAEVMGSSADDMRLIIGTSLRATNSEFDTARAFGTNSSKNRVKAVRPVVGR